MGRWSKKAEPDDVIRITGAPHNPREDIDRRQARYLLSMTIRTLCFIAAVFAVSVPWLCAALIAASFFLPFVAVVIANAAAPRVAQNLQGPGVSGAHGFHELGPGTDRTS
ncbi:MAG: DUF3099 domain-containing protein [Propionibacteriales bacterium]|nr:DUF3099 domain-containing protein [Propionibacteriales bacterium]